jgi:hypothetical protein
MKKLLLMSFASFMFLGALAQKEVRKEIKTEVYDSDKPGKKIVRIEKNINGKVELTEKEIDVKDGDTQVMILDEQLDTVILNQNRGNKATFIIKSENNEDFEWFEEGDDIGDGERQFKIRKSLPNNKRQAFKFEMDKLSDHLAEIPNRMRTIKPNIFDDKIMKGLEPSTVRGLDVFTNKPETNVLNISFFAPKAGDINIIVLDLQGNIKAKEETKNFQGEYVGQVKLSKNLKGTFFIIVSQGEDGVTRKVKID